MCPMCKFEDTPARSYPCAQCIRCWTYQSSAANPEQASKLWIYFQPKEVENETTY